jgi:hypothetical protein
MGGLDPAKILIVLLLAVIILGPERMPKVVRQLGSGWRQLTKLRDRLENEVRSAMPDLDLPSIPTIPTSRGIAGYLGNMMMSAGSSSSAAEITSSETAAPTPLLGSLGAGSSELFDGSRPGGQPASETGGARSPRPASEWRTSYETQPEYSELPAGWHAVGGRGPGYASGSTLAAVPSAAAYGHLNAEASLTFDEPSWN